MLEVILEIVQLKLLIVSILREEIVTCPCPKLQLDTKQDRTHVSQLIIECCFYHI